MLQRENVAMRVLVAGGAGYIGSHTVVSIAEAGHEVVIVDSFFNSKPAVIKRIEALVGKPIEFHKLDLCDKGATLNLFAEVKPEAVIHFAGHKAVGESVAKPISYYQNNLDSALNVLEALKEIGGGLFVFSSSATVYGNGPVPCVETYTPLSSNSPYGWTKVMIEQIATDVNRAHPEIRVALLRYFNPVGAHKSGTIGEDPQGIPNNLMPFISQTATGLRDKITVFGDDYDTEDGTCERDYIHVVDLAQGHVAALEYLEKNPDVDVRAWNLGTGTPTSVLELLHAFEKAAGVEVPYVIGPRRAGDRARLWGDPGRAESELGWKAKITVQDMCADTWNWQSSNPHGYPEDQKE